MFLDGGLDLRYRNATMIDRSADFRTLSPEEIRDAHAAGVEVTSRLLDLRPHETVARRGGVWYLTTTAAVAADLWEPKDGCLALAEVGRGPSAVACERVLAHWEAEAARERAVPEAVMAATRRIDNALASWDPGEGRVALRPSVDVAPLGWETYVREFARPGMALVVGMNPGPHGAMQTGVPFTDPPTLHDLFGDERACDLMASKGPRTVGGWRSVHGTIARREESARRLWGALRHAVDPEGERASHHLQATKRAATHFFLVNAFPIGILDAAKGTNVAPSDLRLPVEVEHRICEWLAELTLVLRPAVTISVGSWARAFVKDACVVSGAMHRIRHLRHPSPLAGSERSWREEADPILAEAVQLVRGAP